MRPFPRALTTAFAAPDTLAVRIGTAGWNIPREVAGAFPADGTHLERYGRVFDAAEINSSFHRPHRTSTYQRWAAAVPEVFRFAVKIPKVITHMSRLHDVDLLLDRFLAEVAGLGDKLGPLLVQLPPSLAFVTETAEKFFRDLRARVDTPVACEPRHASWFAPEVDALLNEFRIGRVAADPAPVSDASRPGGWPGLTYFRLHGSPRVYYSAYSDETVEALVAQLAVGSGTGSECWCIFDNTAAGAATGNALRARRTNVSGAVQS
jgi:uncharacterized protein YecE (DUF72 family)